MSSRGGTPPGSSRVTWLVSLSKVMSHALRHRPWLYELELDGEGWVPVADLVSALRGQGGRWANLTESDLDEVIRTSPKARYEIRGGMIRARYGHSTPGRLSRQAAQPPQVLFHGTSPAAAKSILQQGLRPMGRQYVHLSIDVDTATQVGRRKSSTPVILQVNAADAHAAGVAFFRGNDFVWLADDVPALFLQTVKQYSRDPASGTPS